MTAQPLWFGEHSFDHFSCLAPVAANTCLHECFARPRIGRMRGDDVSDEGSELINDLHGATSFDSDDPCLTAELAPGSDGTRSCADHRETQASFPEYLSAPPPACPLFRNHGSKCHVPAAMD